MKIKMQNKILLDNVIISQDKILLENKDIGNITAYGNVILNLLNCNLTNLSLKVMDNSNLTINYYKAIGEENSNINIEVLNKASFTFNHSYLNYKEYNLNIRSDFKENMSSINLNIHGINDSGKSNIKIDGNVNKNKNDNVLLENIRLININGGTSSAIPNMLIDTSKVIANHNVTISNIRLEELLYLMSKGITKEQSTRLICNGHLVSIISDNELKTKIKDQINGR